MRLSCAIIASVTAVAVAIIDHFELIWGKGRNQFVLYRVGNQHIYVNPLQSLG